MLRTGDSVRVTFEGRTVDATVALASDDGHALALTFDALLGGYAGKMPVLWEDGTFYDLLTRQVVSIMTPEATP
jgi:hypothetical protein